MVGFPVKWPASLFIFSRDRSRICDVVTSGDSVKVLKRERVSETGVGNEIGQNQNQLFTLNKGRLVS